MALNFVETICISRHLSVACADGEFSQFLVPNGKVKNRNILAVSKMYWVIVPIR